MYGTMLRIRAFEEGCLKLSSEGFVAGSIHLGLGQEAIPTGALRALGESDPVFATYRGHGWAAACGVPLKDLLAEVCHRQAGVNGGRGGSAYLTAPRYRFYGENSIVGAGVPIAAGAAMAAKLRDTGQVAVVSIGDGAMNQGSVHEAMNFAAVNRLPLIIICENNGWSEMTPTSSMSLVTDLARRADAYGFPGVVVDGNDPEAVHEAVRRAREAALRREGPTLIECKTVRLSGHYNNDIEHYRPKDDVAQAWARDPIPACRSRVLELGLATEVALADLDKAVQIEFATIADEVRALPAADPSESMDHVYAEAAPDCSTRSSTPPTPSLMTYQMALNTALKQELGARPEVLVYGEDVGFAGGIFGVTRKLQREFGAERVFDTPISESAILGSAVGAAMSGMRPVVEIMWSDFLLVALDQLINQAANVRYVSRSQLEAPLVVRMQQGATPGSCAQHSQSLEALLAHIPGLRVGLPATPQDAYAMLRTAIADQDPTVLLEARSLYQEKGPVDVVDGSLISYGARRYGGRSDIVIVTWGTMVGGCLEARKVLKDAHSIEATVVDLRWLNPLDTATLEAAVADSRGHVLVAHEANRTGGFGAEIAARVSELAFGTLNAPVARLGAPDVRMPAAPSLQDVLIPDTDAVVEACRNLVELGRATDPSSSAIAPQDAAREVAL
jgi:2-oxoisovalerate dehydrogenase E1 component